MPSGIGHIIIGLAILIPILYYTDGKFNKKVAAVFLINNWIGPDSAQAFGFLEDIVFLDFHWLIPFLIWAIPLALVFSFMSRFSIRRTKHFFTVVDDLKREVSWKNAYLLCVSGGVIHTIADAIFRHETYNSTIKLLDNVIQPKLGELYHLASYEQDVGALQAIPFIIMITVLILAVYIVERNYKDILIIYAIICGLTLLLAFGFGDKIIGEEYDIAVIILATIFILIPIMLLFYVEKDVRKNPIEIREKTIIQPEIGLKIIFVFLLIIGAGFLLLGIYALSISPVNNFLDINADLFIFLSYIVISVGALMIFSAIGLILKLRIGRFIAMAISAFLIPLVYPLLIFYFLCRNDVKTLFNKNDNNKISNNGENKKK
ncbi:MAG: hypothetical protein ACTSVV_17580 [Promethearchaeota archaeon]